MKLVSLIPFFALAFFYHFALPSFSGFFPVLYFAPFYSFCYSRKSLFFCVWASFLIGFFLDLCTVSTPIGFYALCSILSTLAIYRFRIYFLEDKPFPFAIYTAIYSFVYSIIFTFLHSFYDTKLKVSFLSFLIDITFLPLLDTIYHLALFTLPVSVYLFLIARKLKALFFRLKKRVLQKLESLKRIKLNELIRR